MAVFICAHGAGGHKDDKAMLRLAAAVEPADVEVVRFNFPYREAGSKRIDPMPVLKKSFVSTVENTKAKRVIIGGRSMGGRVASMLAAEGFECTGCCSPPIRCTRPGSRRSCATRTCRRSAARCCASTARAMRYAGAI